MKCACCGKKTKLLESFEELEKNVNICVDCSKLLYKYQDAVKEKNEEDSKKLLDEIKGKKSEKVLADWFSKFQDRLGVKNIQEDCNMETIKTHIQYWIDYKGSGDGYRRTHDLDCILTGGNLYADTLISLWLPLRYVLNYCNIEQWEDYRRKKDLKNNDDFLHILKDNIQTFITDKQLLGKLEKLFVLGRTRANVIILPYRWWNNLRGGDPYWEYFPHFLYDLLNTEDESFFKTMQEWIMREHLHMFFDGEINKDKIKDLCGMGNPWSHYPGDKQFDVHKLIDNYISILAQRSHYYQNCE